MGDRRDGQMTGERGAATKDEGGNGEHRARPRVDGSRRGMRNDPPIPRAMARRVGWGMLMNTAYPPSRFTVGWQYFLFIYFLGVAFYFYCNVLLSMSDLYYCRKILVK